ncbi:MAG: protein-L-isoaspartate(D-aspartate) O-methyltransferase [Acidobacteria bacterium]|nr:protein-L-isoaspartate(D-aspartate) O-methyltransferase [Acidobacteriota bacterium]
MNLAEIRARFGREMAAKAGLPEDSAVAHAFAIVPREDYVGAPPWRIFGEREGSEAVTDNPMALYQDVLVQLKGTSAPHTGLNNGQPSLHALCFGALRINAGETVIHVGTGTGYYTTMLGVLTGPEGRVDGYEIVRDLAECAVENLRAMPWVRVHAASGAMAPLPECDVLYVSAGATSPLNAWVAALRRGGRLLFPLTPDEGYGAMLLVTRLDEGYAANFLCGAKFVGCVGARDTRMEQSLIECFRTGHAGGVRSLVRDDCPDETAWCVGDGWWLSTRSP